MTSSFNTSSPQRLVEIKTELIHVGAVFTFPIYNFWAGEKYVELMLFQSSAKGALFEFLPIAGYESGKKFGAFILDGYVVGADRDNVNTEWLKNNWNRAVYLDSNLEEVVVRRRDPPVSCETSGGENRLPS